MFIVEFAILIYSVILHEVAHGYMAEYLGDPTARLSGRLTLDPRPHIDLWMTIILPVILLLSGAGIIFGAAKPVPIDPFNFREPKKDTALTALAGPLTNLLIAILLAVVLRVSYLVIVNDLVYRTLSQVLTTGITWNIGLAVFNFLPVPPLDGFKVLLGIVSDDLSRQLYGLERYGFLIIFALLIFFPGVVSALVFPIMHTLLALLLP